MNPGDRLADRFVLREELGRGATGVVWEAWDEPAERAVAVKLLHEHLTGDPQALDVLEAEASAAGRLQHAGIVRVHGLWSDGGRRLLVTERVDGGTLAAHDGPMAPDRALEVAEQVARALLFAHQTGRVHGDVRPGNVLLGSHGARVFDFGLASWVGAIDGLEGPVPTVRAGCTAPEILDGGPPARPADLYGVGVVLYRAWTGELPWQGPTPFAVMGAQRAGPPPMKVLPPGVRRLVQALLHPEADRRPSDMAQVVRAIVTLRRHPRRVVSLGGRWFAPVRPLGAWIVHGRDPATGGPAVVREGLSRRGALALVKRLREEGWEVEASKEALDVVDLAWTGAWAAAATWLLPAAGWLLAIPLALRWRSLGLRDQLRSALPVVRAPLPARRLPPGNEVAVAAGLLLMVLVPSLVLFPPLALPIVLALAWLASRSWRPATDPVGEAARSGRIETALAEAAALIEARELDLDTNLGLHGELLAVEREWRGGGAEPDEVLLRAQDLASRARALRGSELFGLPRGVPEGDADGS